MKIRTDFVTNSSSSSYLTILVQTKDGKSKEIFYDEAGMDDNDMGELPRVENGKLYAFKDHERGEELTSSIELAAALCRIFNSTFDDKPLDEAVELLKSYSCKSDLESQQYRRLVENFPSLDDIKSIVCKTVTEEYGEFSDNGEDTNDTSSVRVSLSGFRKFSGKKRK